jgi:hypothetical protein
MYKKKTKNNNKQKTTMSVWKPHYASDSDLSPLEKTVRNVTGLGSLSETEIAARNALNPANWNNISPKRHLRRSKRVMDAQTSEKKKNQ